MRKTLSLAALAAAVAVLAPVAPASAYCDATLSGIAGECVNGCVVAGRAYGAVREAAGHKYLPDLGDCPA
jgi:hypothetical protein